MNYGKILGVFQRKTQLKNIENLKLSEGKIEVNYFKSILKNHYGKLRTCRIQPQKQLCLALE